LHLLKLDRIDKGVTTPSFRQAAPAQAPAAAEAGSCTAQTS
jgi:hypothetical protein